MMPAILMAGRDGELRSAMWRLEVALTLRRPLASRRRTSGLHGGLRRRRRNRRRLCAAPASRANQRRRELRGDRLPLSPGRTVAA